MSSILTELVAEIPLFGCMLCGKIYKLVDNELVLHEDTRVINLLKI